MIKKTTVCMCDICGKTVNAKPIGTQYNETDYGRPNGWSGGATESTDICPECMAKFNLSVRDYDSFTKQVK